MGQTELDGSEKDVTAPGEWESYVNSTRKWSQIRMKEVVWSDLDPGVVDAIRRIAEIDRCGGKALEKVQRLDPQTIELVYYNDTNEEDSSPSFLSRVTVDNLREEIKRLYGEHWRITRKEWNDPDSRWAEHPQRLLVRRASHQRFKYQDEDEPEYLARLNGVPDGAPEDATYWKDVDAVQEPPEEVNWRQNIYIYESGAGTCHIVKRGNAVREKPIATTFSTACGTEVDPEAVVEGERFAHFGEHVQAHIDAGEIPSARGPKELFGEDLCMACWRSYGQSDGDDGYRAPTSLYNKLVPWPGEVSVDV